jgi:hypothetical protein
MAQLRVTSLSQVGSSDDIMGAESARGNFLGQLSNRMIRRRASPPRTVAAHQFTDIMALSGARDDVLGAILRQLPASDAVNVAKWAEETRAASAENGRVALEATQARAAAEAEAAAAEVAVSAAEARVAQSEAKWAEDARAAIALARFLRAEATQARAAADARVAQSEAMVAQLEARAATAEALAEYERAGRVLAERRLEAHRVGVAVAPVVGVVRHRVQIEEEEEEEEEERAVEVMEEEEEEVEEVEEEEEQGEEVSEEKEDEEEEREEEEAGEVARDGVLAGSKRPRKAGEEEDGAKRSGGAHSSQPAASTPRDGTMDLSGAGDDMLRAILSYLPASDAVAVSQCDRRWSYVAEESFQQRCQAKGWRLSRRTRAAGV